MSEQDESLKTGIEEVGGGGGGEGGKEPSLSSVDGSRSCQGPRGIPKEVQRRVGVGGRCRGVVCVCLSPHGIRTTVVMKTVVKLSSGGTPTSSNPYQREDLSR